LSERDAPTLVVVQLTGGNDALNTVVPYGDPLYYDRRPTVHIAPDVVLPIDGRYGFHPSMATMKPLWDEGRLAIVAGIGHARPDYSHFRSLDIWYTAEPERVAQDGWLGKTVRELDPRGENVLTAVNIGRGLPRALSLSGVPVASVARLDSYGLLTALSGVDERASALEVFSCMYDDGMNDNTIKVPLRTPHPDDPRGPVLRYLGRTGLDAKKGAEILASAVGGYRSTVRYPLSAIAANLKAIAQIKLAGLGTRIFYTDHGGFDTHASQLAPHAKLWLEAAEAIAAFFADLRAHDAAREVVMLIFSEFGRRVADNGGGTDHGAASVAFVIGDAVKGGFYGEYPSLRDADLELGGNLRYTTDFRSTYSSILEGWLKVEPRTIVRGSFEQLGFV
jgi:uncharacterized protein (DUF1501 family)